MYAYCVHSTTNYKINITSTFKITFSLLLLFGADHRSTDWERGKKLEIFGIPEYMIKRAKSGNIHDTKRIDYALINFFRIESGLKTFLDERIGVECPSMDNNESIMKRKHFKFSFNRFTLVSLLWFATFSSYASNRLSINTSEPFLD